MLFVKEAKNIRQLKLTEIKYILILPTRYKISSTSTNIKNKAKLKKHRERFSHVMQPRQTKGFNLLNTFICNQHACLDIQQRFSMIVMLIVNKLCIVK